MGDRTTVCLYVLTEHADRVKEFLEKPDDEYAYFDEINAVSLVCFTYFEVNYAELDHLDYLIKEGIPYNYLWNKGDEYDGGNEFCRFTSTGEVIHREWDDYDNNPDIDELLKLVNDPNQLIHFIKEYKEQHTIPGWANQIEYGKIHQLKEIIEA